MFREMRRFKQQLSNDECKKILHAGKTGILAVLGDSGYPYAVPLNYNYDGDAIYLHCAKSGHKLDAIKRNSKVSFCVVDRDDIFQEKLTTLYRSVVIFGNAEIIKDESEMRRTVTELAEKYRPDFISEISAEVDSDFERLCMIKINIEHMTGKQGKELLNQQ